MRPAVSDTDEATERLHLDLLRQASAGRRLQMALSLSATVVGLSRRGLARAHPGSTRQQLAIRFVERHYGHRLARELQAHLGGRDA
ncbi:MAG TPA: hypothetical protein VLI67_01460 [Vicinamibacteria bacterium]|nr:hypothetical protein [Vicinamibacteria bacterium]